MKTALGEVMVITGDGKGKTTMALGLAVQWAAAGQRVAILQFKGNGYSGELAAPKYVEGLTIRQFGYPCPRAQEIRAGEQSCLSCGECFRRNRHKDNPYIAAAMRYLQEILADPQITGVVVDEISYPVQRGAISLAVTELFAAARDQGKRIVLTGRSMPERLLELADKAVECGCLEHPKTKGIAARWGIEY